MDILAPLSTAVPLGGAAVLGGANRLLPRRLRDGLAFMVAATTTGLVLALMVTAARGPTVYWFSGWRPVHRVVIGVDYAFGSLGAGLAALAGLLACAALVYSSRFFETVGGLSHTLVLIFLAASADFCLTGDLFNLFVAFELVAVTGFVLTGYNANKTAPLQGAINFAVSNSLAGMVVLFGVALVYARTGALNLAQIGQYLAGRRADGVVVVAFALLIGGFLIKAAAVPFHFWVPDAYGAAPIPACVLFSGVMSELGLFAVARVWETAFSGLGGGAGHGLRFVLIGFGILTAVVGPLMALVQTHLKRMLAFLTMSHLGLYLIGFGLLSPLGLAGASLLAVGVGLAKAAMFFGVGALQKQRGSVNETKLRGLGASLPVLGVVVALGALVAPTCPPSCRPPARTCSYGRPTSRVWGGSRPWWRSASSSPAGPCCAPLAGSGSAGPSREPTAAGPESDDDPGDDSDDDYAERIRGRTPIVMGAPPVVLLAVALALGLVPNVAQRALDAASSFPTGRPTAPPCSTATPWPSATVLPGPSVPPPPPAPPSS